MKLHELKISGLYGYIDKRIQFHDDVNLLVRINGSGKTSVLKLIDWMLRPSLPDLCTTKLKEVSLTFSRDGSVYKLRFVQSRGRAQYLVSEKGRPSGTFHPLDIGLSLPAEAFLKRPELKELTLRDYRHLTPIRPEFKTWRFLNELPKPLVLGLDRTPVKDPTGVRRSDESRMSPIDQVKQLANAGYSASRTRIIELNNDLKNQIMRSAFNRLALKRRAKSKQHPVPGEREILTWKDRVTKYLRHPHSPRHSTAVHLLKSGVDLSTIAHWLGHSSINTTHKYVSIDLEAKRAALAKAAPITTKTAAGESAKICSNGLNHYEGKFYGVHKWSW